MWRDRRTLESLDGFYWRPILLEGLGVRQTAQERLADQFIVVPGEEVRLQSRLLDRVTVRWGGFLVESRLEVYDSHGRL